jgi:hypothetical protein
MSGVFRHELRCQVAVVAYDYCSRIGKLIIDERDSCDGRAAIELFLKIDPEMAQVS